MLELILLWLALFGVLILFVVRRTGFGGALTLAYFSSLSVLHVPGVLPYLDPTNYVPRIDETRLGFEMTLIGMAAFVLGGFVAAKTATAPTLPDTALPTGRRGAYERLGRQMILLGLAAYFFLLPVSGVVPSLTAVISALATLIILGLWVFLYGAWQEGSGGRLIGIFAFLPILPLATLTTGGFIGFGVNWVLSTLAFLFVLTKRRIWFYAAAPVVIFLGLSLFVTYMGQRVGIRETVWQQNAGYLDRLDRISTIVTDFHTLDLTARDDVNALEDRLNQNWLVGTAILNHEAGFTDYVYGATIPLWALIPRAIWPDKPTVGGSGDVVSEFTGIRFARGTSVGIGQVLEFYINFGTFGVVVGFAALGYALMRLDRGIMRALAMRDVRGIVLRAMPGLTLLQPGGSLVEISVACAAAYLGGYLILSIPALGIAIPRVAQPA